MWKWGLTALWLGILSLLDFFQKRVPVWILAVGGIPAVVVTVYTYMGGTRSAADIALGMIPGGLLLIVAVVSKKAGWADGIVLLIIGLLTNFQDCLVCFVVSLIAISVVSLLLLTLRKVRKNAILPYLPFLLVSYLIQAAIIQ